MENEGITNTENLEQEMSPTSNENLQEPVSENLSAADIDEIVAEFNHTVINNIEQDVVNPTTNATPPPNNAVNEEQEQQEAINDSAFAVFNDISIRFTGAAWAKMMQKSCITIIGVGGIGSHLAFLISRLQPQSINVYDSDTVELNNLGGQLYGFKDVGKSKTRALSNLINNLSMYYTINMYQNFSSIDTVTKITLCGLDSMKARKTAFLEWKKTWETNPSAVFIDGRLAAEEFQIFTIKGDDARAIDEYTQKWLFNDDEAIQETCSYKQTTFCASMIASYMTSILVNFQYNCLHPQVERCVPFFISCNIPYMLLNITE